MSEQMHTIGDLSRLSGISVRRIRFYSDKGLLPPVTRTVSNYRVYSHADAARLDLIRTLREAGISLAAIRKILSRHLSLREVLAMRLETLEAEIASRRRIASVLRTTLKIDQPTETDLRRLWTMTTLSQTQMRITMERFYDKAAANADMGEDWKRQMIDASMPELPDDPTSRQIDAWNEITAMITDESFLAEMQADTATMWNGEFDAAAYAEAANSILASVRTAIDEGKDPLSPTGRAIAREWLAKSAKAMRREPDRAFLDWHLGQYRKHHARSARYQELLAILRGEEPDQKPGNEWQWINRAMTPLLSAPGR
ncbi:MAG TPA: MerR family transcriptional regulator [Mesorhizobium sp.]|jgi:DNA-binding transcriptional MerR regulator|uniref:helix-turn-helix domain-containing protein n=1 Tax=Mesorhizobium sp. TaxID=1871066 RepID=UPI002DDD961D|nr:MerR family transcriptional regulator [Mesorhizobium sp.]HEV2502137.1 MerR family transcriptional regulator [Mesorhizobium sp.]